MTKEVFEQIQEGLEEALTVARREKATVTDEMVSLAVEAYNTTHPGHLANRDQMCAALTAALSPSPVEVETDKNLRELVERAQSIISTSTYPNWHATASAALTTSSTPADGEDATAPVTHLEGGDDGDEDACVVCGEHLEDGDPVYWSANDDGHMHAECAKSYVDDDGKETDVPPAPFAFRADPSPLSRALPTAPSKEGSTDE